MSAPEFSRPLRFDTLGDVAREVTITADAAEREQLAARFGLRALGRLEATATVTRTGDVVRADGRIAAAVVQACVATGADVLATIDEPFAVRFVPEGKGGGDDVELGEGDLDDIGYAGGAVDLGEAAAQTLALALDPFPRAADADAALRAAGVLREGEETPRGALAGLRDLLKP